MTLPMVSAMFGAWGDRWVRRAPMLAGAMLLLFAANMAAAPHRARAGDDSYSATVKVDATADTAEKARELARLDGQRRALAAVIGHLSGATDPAKLTKLDDKTITDLSLIHI